MKNTQILIAEECDRIKKILLQKNKEYGDSVLNPIRIFSTASTLEQINVRIDDKLSRVKYMQTKEVSIKEDTSLDLIGYLILKRIKQALLSKSVVPGCSAEIEIKK